MSRFRSIPGSFKYAFDGLREAVQKEPNFRIHLAASIAVLVLGAFLGFSAFEWLLLLFTITFVLVLELLNTSIESMVNLVSPNIRPQAKIAKDVAAAMVLVGSIMAIIVGAVLFIPKILPLLPI